MDDRTKPPIEKAATTVRRPEPPQQSEPELEAPKTIWPLKVQLANPIDIRATDGTQQAYITELEFRQPTGADLIACGIPVSVDYRTNSPRIEPDVMAVMIARLSGKPPAYLQRMESKDFVTCCWKLRDFFLPNFDQLI